MKLKSIFSCSDPSWFDSTYYHSLYKDRNEDEAHDFVKNLVGFLKPDSKSKMLDLACGRGRHAIHLHDLGFDVTGVDASVPNIRFAEAQSKPGLQFFVHDMRNAFRVNEFDFIFNLFTSFGYFEKEEENIQVLKEAGRSLKANGILVLDFFNSAKIIREIVSEEQKTVDGISFLIKRKIEKNMLIKEIVLNDCGKKQVFHEAVSLLMLPDFEHFLKQSGFQLLHKFGNYALDPFEQRSSDRMILIAGKK